MKHRIVYVIQWADLQSARSSGCDLWRDYGQCLPEYDTIEDAAGALIRFRRWEACRPHPVRLRAVKRIIVDEWLVGL